MTTQRFCSTCGHLSMAPSAPPCSGCSRLPGYGREPGRRDAWELNPVLRPREVEADRKRPDDTEGGTCD